MIVRKAMVNSKFTIKEGSFVIICLKLKTASKKKKTIFFFWNLNFQRNIKNKNTLILIFKNKNLKNQLLFFV